MLLDWVKAQVKRSRRLVAAYSSVRWRIHVLKDWWGTRIWTRTTEVNIPQGFALNAGFHPAYDLMRAGQFEPEETELFCRLVMEVERFIDVGANVGYYTCLALDREKPVLAFEPQVQNLRCLYQNLLSNGWQRECEVYPVALGSAPGLLPLYGASGPSASLVQNWAGYSSRYKQIVPVAPLDNILSGRFEGERLLIKIDVEGAEHFVLTGSTATLARTPRPIWILEICLQEFHPQGRNPHFREIFELFRANGYAAYTVTLPPRLVTSEDVDRGWDRRQVDFAGFDYVFVESRSILEQAGVDPEVIACS